MLLHWGLASLSGMVVWGCVVPSALAQRQVTQTTTQEVVINGDNNRVIQVTNQITIDNSRRGIGRGRSQSDRTNTTSQDSFQRADVRGSGNRIGQFSDQHSIQRERDADRRFSERDNDSKGKGRSYRNRDDDD